MRFAPRDLASDAARLYMRVAWVPMYIEPMPPLINPQTSCDGELIFDGRGTVRRVDRGTVEFEQASEPPSAGDPERYHFRLSGGRLSGRFELTRDGDGWELSIAGIETRP